MVNRQSSWAKEESFACRPISKATVTTLFTACYNFLGSIFMQTPDTVISSRPLADTSGRRPATPAPTAFGPIPSCLRADWGGRGDGAAFWLCALSGPWIPSCTLMRSMGFPNKFLSPAGPIFALLGCPLGVACRNELMVIIQWSRCVYSVVVAVALVLPRVCSDEGEKEKGYLQTGGGEGNKHKMP